MAPLRDAADFEGEDVEQLRVGELAIAVYRAEGKLNATQDLCTREHAYLSDGVVVDCVVECPFHQRARFRHPQRKSARPPGIRAAQNLFDESHFSGRPYVHVTKAAGAREQAARRKGPMRLT